MRDNIKDDRGHYYCVSSTLCFELYVSSNCCGFLMVNVTTTLELAQVSFLPDELGVVVLAVEASLVRNVVRWTDCAPSMCAFEAHLVVGSSIHRNLLTDQISKECQC